MIVRKVTITVMKKRRSIIYIVICLAVCLIPFVGMTFARTDSTTENRRMAKLPHITEEGRVNVGYLSELGLWFEDHFAFRPYMVMADSLIQSKVFKVSNMDTVLVGRDGWLYYTSTLSDYLGTDVMTEKSAWNAAHNLYLTSEMVKDRGGVFLLTVAPNKNTLYGEHMPYYDSKIVNTTGNMELLEAEMEGFDITYADLFEVFENEQETLYLKRDSHWNNKGAVLAYNRLLDELTFDHETYETVPAIREKNEYGDLNKMLYPIDFEPEWNYEYQKDDAYTYVTDTESVEDAFIETANESAGSSLLMFRDSFGNTLLPLMANTFGRAYFSKAVPYNVEDYVDSYHPEYVIVEKVERNIADFADAPPIMTGPLVEINDDIQGNGDTHKASDGLNIGECEYDADYWLFSGRLEELKEKGSVVYVRILTSDGQSHCYEAFTTTDGAYDNGYMLYVAKDNIVSGDVAVQVLAKTGGTIELVAEESFNTGLIGP